MFLTDAFQKGRTKDLRDNLSFTLSDISDVRRAEGELGVILLLQGCRVCLW